MVRHMGGGTRACLSTSPAARPQSLSLTYDMGERGRADALGGEQRRRRIGHPLHLLITAVPCRCALERCAGDQDVGRDLGGEMGRGVSDGRATSMEQSEVSRSGWPPMQTDHPALGPGPTMELPWS